jgi:hypothetical protein
LETTYKPTPKVEKLLTDVIFEINTGSRKAPHFRQHHPTHEHLVKAQEILKLLEGTPVPVCLAIVELVTACIETSWSPFQIDVPVSED